MKDKFENIAPSGAIYELTKLLQYQQDKRSKNTGFGYGFDRWIYSNQLLTHLNSVSTHIFTFAEIACLYKELAKRGLIQIKKSSSRGMLAYSTLGWEGCRNINDYFIEDETIDSH